MGVRAAEGQRTVAGLDQAERESPAVLQRSAESGGGAIAAGGQSAVIGRTGVLHRAGAGQGADGSIEVIQAEDAGGLNDVGRSVAEALGDAGLQDAFSHGGRTGIGAARDGESQDARAGLLETEGAGDGAAHGEGGAVGPATDDIPTLVGAEHDRGADGDDAGAGRHVDAIRRHGRSEGQRASRARGDCDRSDSARIGGEFEILDAKIRVQDRGNRRATGGVGAEDDPIVHAGETVGVGAGQISREIAAEQAVGRPVAVAQGVAPVKIGREGGDAETDEGVSGGQRAGAAGEAGETT